MRANPSGYYAWLKEPECKREKDDRYYLGFIKQFWLESGGVYGYRKVYQDMQYAGELCGKHRVARLMKSEGLNSLRGYKRRAHRFSGELSQVADNHLNRQFEVAEPNKVWVTDITYIKTYEGWLFLTVVIDLFSRQVVGWSMDKRINTQLAMNALIMALWRRKPKGELMIHSDQGCQFTSYDWTSLLKSHGLKVSMSRRGNCHDNAVAESFFQLLKRERIKRRTYKNREEAKQDIFDYIEMFYNPVRRHGSNNDLSPCDYEKEYFMKLESV